VFTGDWTTPVNASAERRKVIIRKHDDMARHRERYRKRRQARQENDGYAGACRLTEQQVIDLFREYGISWRKEGNLLHWDTFGMAPEAILALWIKMGSLARAWGSRTISANDQRIREAVLPLSRAPNRSSRSARRPPLSQEGKLFLWKPFKAKCVMSFHVAGSVNLQL
jgi:hypothetical protein